MKKGFTLIELLATIIILAIILSIAIPNISSILVNSDKASFQNDTRKLIKLIYLKRVNDVFFDVSTINEANIEELLNIPADNYNSVVVTTKKGEIYVVIQGKGEWADLLTYGTYDNVKVTDSSNYNNIVNQLGYDSDKGVNQPKLVAGMTPIKWNGSKWVDTTEDDTDWYKYDTTDRKWANARTEDGSMWVWIPRYIYKISSGWHSSTTGTIEIQFSKGIDDNWNSGVIGNIDTGTTSNASNNKWTNHPGFTFGSTEVTGIWVAKFEATAAEGIGKSLARDNVVNKTVKIIPNVVAWKYIYIGNMFTVTRNMETNTVYGWGATGNGIDTHLMKNSEWGAVAYLSKSTYGRNSSFIWVDNSIPGMTGCVGSSDKSPTNYDGCQYSYSTSNGVNGSTTGTIYGVYDVSGSFEAFAAYLDNGTGNLNTYGSSLVSADIKYKDVYTVGATDDASNNYALTINKKGDALYETSSSSGSNAWFTAHSSMPYSTSPWLIRNTNISGGVGGDVFDFGSDTGSTSVHFRPVLIVETDL